MIGLAAALFAVAASAPGGAVHRAAVIVGVNDPFEPTQPTLRYADDDAARYHELLLASTAEVVLLTVLDADSQRLFPAAASEANVPTREALERAISAVSRRARAARAAGARSELYLVYTGHGRARGGEGAVKLAGGELRRAELLALVEQAGFDRTHLFVDACDAYHLVHARGEEDQGGSAGLVMTEAFDASFERFTESRSIERLPSVGVVLSTSGPGATHEWSRLQGGVFSHEIRSALAGAADADRDGRVDYAELEAFVAAANLAIPELRGRPRVFVRPPAIDRRAAVLDLPAGAPVIELGPAISGRYWLEDDRGVRFAELHKVAGEPVLLRVVPRPSYALVRPGGGRVAVVDPVRGRVAVDGPLAELPAGSTERSGPPANDEPPGLFAEPFGTRFADGFRARLDAVQAGAGSALAGAGGPSVAGALAGPAPPAVEEDEGSTLLWVAGLTAGGLALGALSGAIWQGVAADASYARYDAALDPGVRDRAGAEVVAERERALGLGIAAGVGAAASAILLWAALD